MSNDPSNTGSALDEQLVAYLDGELDAESGRRIEALLASDAEVRRRLQSLERTWDLLDELDAAPVGEPFTQTTLEMVAVAAHEDVERERAEAPRRRRRRLLATGGGLLAAAAAGFLAVVLLGARPQPATARRPARAGELRRIPASREHRVSPRTPRQRAVFHGGRRVARRRGGESRGLADRGGGASKSMGLAKRSNCCGSKSRFTA